MSDKQLRTAKEQTCHPHFIWPIRHRLSHHIQLLQTGSRPALRFTKPCLHRRAGLRGVRAQGNQLKHRVSPKRQRTCWVRVPGERRAVAFAGRDEAARLTEAAYFADRGDRVGDVEEEPGAPRRCRSWPRGRGGRRGR